MIRWFVCFLSLVLFCSCYHHSSLPSVQESALPHMTREMIQMAYDQMNALPVNTEFSIAVVEGTGTHYVGLRKTDRGVELINNQQSVFEIGSITKVFTSHLLMDAIEKGVITDLDQPIQEVIEFPLKEETPITFRQLASHTAGLPRLPSNLGVSLATYQNPYAEYTDEDLENHLASDLILDHIPGTTYQYSNLGAGILGYILSDLQEQSYENLLQAHILEPLDMERTTACRRKVESALISPLNKDGEAVSHWDFQSLVGAGGIFSTAQDLATYARFHFHQAKGMQASQFRVDRNMEVGLGWHRKLNASTSPIIWHNGGTGGFKSCMAMLPDQELAVIVLSNVSALQNPKSEEVDNLCFTWLDWIAQKAIAAHQSK